jgi:hypothetical protein
MKLFIKTLGFAALMLSSLYTQAEPITYTALVLSDVQIGKQLYTGVPIYLSFRSDTSTALPFADTTGYGYRNEVGEARVTIVAGHRTITARFEPNQVFVFYDVAHSSVGFGSHVTAGRGYPLALTALEDTDGLAENSTIGAVSDLTRVPANAGNYSPATATLRTNLANETDLSGAASSCVQFDPKTSVCSNLTPVALRTDRGDFLIYEPYTVDYSTNPAVPQPHSVNWGIFWSSMMHKDEGEDSDH